MDARLLMLWLSAGICASLPLSEPSAGSLDFPNGGTDLVCGPRCAVYLLEKFGVSNKEDFIDTVREIQGVDLEKGAALSEISEYLKNSGLTVQNVRKRSWQEIHCKCPIILHVINQGEGHFLVREIHEDQVRYWDGLHGFLTKLPDHYEITGFAVAVSDEPTIDDVTRPKLLAITGIVIAAVFSLAFLFNFNVTKFTNFKRRMK